MRKSILIPILFVVCSCNSNTETKQSILKERNNILIELKLNSDERKHQIERLEFIGLEIQSLNNGLTILYADQRDKRVSELKKEIKSIIELNKELDKNDSVLMVEAEKLKVKYDKLK